MFCDVERGGWELAESPLRACTSHSQPLVFSNPANHGRAFPPAFISKSNIRHKAGQSASHRYTKRCRHLSRLIYTASVPRASASKSHLQTNTCPKSRLHLFAHNSNTRHTLININKQTHSYPTTNADTRRKNSFVSQPDPQA